MQVPPRRFSVFHIPAAQPGPNPEQALKIYAASYLSRTFVV
jgi:hypothetical protein